jgi:hypothetical protein
MRIEVGNRRYGTRKNAEMAPCAGCKKEFDKNILSRNERCPDCVGQWIKDFQENPTKRQKRSNADLGGLGDKCDGCNKPMSSDMLHTVKAEDGIHTKELCSKCAGMKNAERVLRPDMPPCPSCAAPYDMPPLPGCVKHHNPDQRWIPKNDAKNADHNPKSAVGMCGCGHDGQDHQDDRSQPGGLKHPCLRWSCGCQGFKAVQNDEHPLTPLSNTGLTRGKARYGKSKEAQ